MNLRWPAKLLIVIIVLIPIADALYNNPIHFHQTVKLTDHTVDVPMFWAQTAPPREEMLVAKHPVQVTCVHPGGIKTAVARNATVSDDHDQHSVAEFFDRKLAIHTPEFAAKTIVDGVAKGHGRVLIGYEAKVLDVLQRVTASGYQRLVALAAPRMMPRKAN